VYKVTKDSERLSCANGRSDVSVAPEGVIEFSSRPKYENVVISVFREGNAHRASCSVSIVHLPVAFV
jgi:hypothetical protein